MANYPVIFRNDNGKLENLLPADGGIQIDVIDCAAANSTVSIFDTVDNGGSLSLFAAYNGNAGIGTTGSVFTFGGGLTVTQNLTVTTNTILNGDVDLGNASGDAITVVGSVDSNIGFENSAPRSITIDSQTLVISVTTAGKLQLDGAAEIELNTVDVDINASAGVQIDAVSASQFVVSGGTDDLTLGARGATITLNQSGNTALDTNFTATSIIGAINEVKTSNLGVSTPNAQASEVIVAGDTVCIDWDAGNGRPGIYLADATVAGRRDACGIALNGGAIGTVIYIATAGQEAIINTLIAANNEGNPVYLYGAGAGGVAGQLTLTPPKSGVGGWVAGDVSQIVGVVSLSGAAGSAKIFVQLRESVDL